MGKPIRVLYLDDDLADRELVFAVLGEEQGRFTVTLVVSQAELEASLVAGGFDVALSNLNLPGLEGLCVIDAIHAVDASLPVVIVTSSGSEEIAVEAMKRGADDYVIKHLQHMRRLPLIIEAVLERQRLLRERQAAQAQSNHLASLLEQVTDAIVSSDLSFHIRSWNRGAEMLYGWRADEAIGHKVAEIVPSLYPGECFEQARHQFLQDGFWRGEVIQQRRDGTTLHLLSSVTLLRDEAGQPSGMVAVNHDITARRQAEATMRLQSAALDAAANGILITDRQGKIEWVNRAFCTLTGYSAAEALGRKPGELLDSGAHSPTFFAELWSTIVAGKIWHGELLNRDKHGSLYAEEQTITPVRDAGGTISHFIAIKQDISERRQAEDLVHKRLELMEFVNNHTLAEVLQKMLDQIGDLINSPIGFYHFVDRDQQNLSLQAWSTRTLREFCTAVGEDLHCPISQAGVWADCVHARRPIIHNDYASLPQRKGLPEGHALVIRELVVPIMRDDLIVAILGVANKPSDYTDRDVELVTYYAELAWEVAERKQAEKTLRRYQLLSNHANDAMFFIHPADGRILDANLAAQLLYGYSIEQFCTMTVADLRLPNDTARIPGQLARAATHGICFETVHRHQDGHSFPVEISSHGAEIEGRQLLLSIVRDISGRKQTEQALRESEQRYRALFEAARDAILIIDSVTGCFVNCNQPALKLFSATRDQVIGQRPHGTLSPPLQPDGSDSQLASNERIAASLAGTAQFFEWRHRRLDGTLFDAEISMSRVEVSGRTLLLAIVRDITERKRADEALRQRLDQLQALQTIDRAISTSFDARITLEVLLDQLIALLGVDAAGVLLFNPLILTLDPAVGRGFRTQLYERSQVRIGEGLTGRAALEQQIVQSTEAAGLSDPSRTDLYRREGFVSQVAVPFMAKGQLKGVLEVFLRHPLRAEAEWVEFLSTLAGQAAIAIDNIQLFENLQRANLEITLAYDATIEGWSRALDLRDHETEGHTQRVTELSVQLGRAAGISDEDLVHVRRGALLHDIGKMGIPDAVLLKPGPLTDDEWVIMRLHPTYAYELLAPISYLRQALEIPFCHHEQWDGSGYPRGLRGEAIPLAARLFAVVDVWDALRSDRPYRNGWPDAEVRRYLREQAGHHFDPRAVELFFQVLDE